MRASREASCPSSPRMQAVKSGTRCAVLAKVPPAWGESSTAQHRSRSSTQHAAPRASCSLLWQIARAVGQVRTGQDRQSQRPSRHHTHRQRQLHSLLDIHSLVEPISLSEGTICTLSRLFTATVLSLSRVRARRRAAQPALRMPSSAPSRHAR